MNSDFRELKYTVTTEDGSMLARDIMQQRMKLSSREITRCKLFEDGVMCHDAGDSDPLGKRAIFLKDELMVGDTLYVRIYEDIDNGSEIIPSDHPLDIVYEDEDLIVINKPGNMVVHPSYCHYTDSLSNYLAGYYKKTGQNHVMRVIGRLDRETSGLLIFAKNRHSAALLSDQCMNMSRRKEYVALCEGVFAEKEGTVNEPIWENPKEKMIREVRPDGKEAITHYRVVKQFEDFAMVRLVLDTGRTHQIRVHMSYLGHPLLGDSLYGKEILNNHGMERAALHAAHLEFLQPITEEAMSFEAKLPADMYNAINS